MSVEMNPRSRRSVVVAGLAALLIAGVLLHTAPAPAEELLVKDDGSEYLGFDQDDGTFETCGGSTVDYDVEAGDRIEETDEICEEEDDPWPDLVEDEEDEPPLR